MGEESDEELHAESEDSLSVSKEEQAMTKGKLSSIFQLLEISPIVDRKSRRHLIQRDLF